MPRIFPRNTTGGSPVRGARRVSQSLRGSLVVDMPMSVPSAIVSDPPQLSRNLELGLIGVPVIPQTLPSSQTVYSGYRAVVFETLVIPTGVTLTIESGAFVAMTTVVYVP